MLQGAELIAKVKSMADAPKSEIVRKCGYVSVVNDKERLNYINFYEALLDAKGVALKSKKRMGRKLTHKAKIQSDGKVIVGSAYIQDMNLDPNTVFNIEVGRTKVVLTAAAAD
jgi:hypothetical protein|tara:strand:- start:225 stop:563 length:339 start_codon:yes stop_codon:yes gene_type:complete